MRSIVARSSVALVAVALVGQRVRLRRPGGAPHGAASGSRPLEPAPKKLDPNQARFTPL